MTMAPGSTTGFVPLKPAAWVFQEMTTPVSSAPVANVRWGWP